MCHGGVHLGPCRAFHNRVQTPHSVPPGTLKNVALPMASLNMEAEVSQLRLSRVSLLGSAGHKVKKDV